MHAPEQVERLWLRRLRWRMRGAWQWPAFGVLTVLDGVILARLPFYARGPGSVVGGVLLAAFANLVVVAVVAPLVGLRVRRRRPDLPRLVASDYAGAGALLALTALLVLGGVLHRPAVAAERADVAVVVQATSDYVVRTAPSYRSGVTRMDPMRVEEDLYRSCVPGPDPERWLCVFVSTDRHPPKVVRDHDEAPNDVYRMHGGFR